MKTSQVPSMGWATMGFEPILKRPRVKQAQRNHRRSSLHEEKHPLENPEGTWSLIPSLKDNASRCIVRECSGVIHAHMQAELIIVPRKTTRCLGDKKLNLLAKLILNPSHYRWLSNSDLWVMSVILIWLSGKRAVSMHFIKVSGATHSPNGKTAKLIGHSLKCGSQEWSMIGDFWFWM